MLSVVLPIRVGPRTRYLLDRLAANLAFFGGHADVECVVVDSASAPRDARAVARLCARPGVRRVVDPAPQQPFAPGATRNVGAAHAAGTHLLFWDVDLCAGPGLLDGVRAWIAAPRAPAEFAILPCLYLGERATAALGFAGAPVDLAPHRRSLLAGEADLVTHLAASTSTIVVRRDHFLAVGGNRAAYRGHGCEDFDLLHRLASFAPLGPRPADYHADVKTPFVGGYRGFRAYLARYALPHLWGPLHTAHLHHPRPLARRYFRRRRDNEALLQRSMRAHDAAPPPPGLPPPWALDGGPPLPPLDDVLRAILAAHGVSPDDAVGLWRWRDGVAPRRGTPWTKARKLLLRPRQFLADARLPALRALVRRPPR